MAEEKPLVPHGASPALYYHNCSLVCYKETNVKLLSCPALDIVYIL
jgi:hypothetical protein